MKAKMKKQDSFSITDHAEKLFLWIDESFVCSLFKADLNLRWFCAYAQNLLQTRTEDFDKTVENLSGDSILKREMKTGYQIFLSYIEESLDSIPENYDDLSIEEKLNINANIADGIIESTSLLLKGYTERKLEDEVEHIKNMHPKWVNAHGVWLNRERNIE